jgi:hypothetical protein
MDRKSGLALATFILLTTFVAAHHEPWRDEADSWLMARDASFGQMLHIAGYAGTPVLWYVIQAPLAKAGAPYDAQRYLHLLISASAVGLLLSRAPFPFVLRVSLAFSYFLSFEYAVVARNYSSGILLCFAVLAMDRERRRLAPFYGLAIGLAASASVHFTVFATALLVPFAWEAWRSRLGRRVWLGIALALAGIAFAVWQLWPPTGGQLPTGLFTRFELFRIRETLAQAFAPRARGGEWALVLGLLVTALTVARLWAVPRAALVFALSCAGLGYVFVFKYASGVHHYGLFFIAVVSALWMAEGSTAAATPRAVTSRRVFSIAFVVLLMPSLYVAVRVWSSEVKYAFSEAADMARFIEASGLAHARIAAHPPMAATAVLAPLPRRTFWYPAIGEEGSHMKWDTRDHAGWRMPVTRATGLMKAQCPDWQDPGSPVLLLLNRPLPDGAAEGYRLLYATPGHPWIVTDEVFYLYVPTNVDTDWARRAAGLVRAPTCSGGSRA